jgi:hypothetical protein
LHTPSSQYQSPVALQSSSAAHGRQSHPVAALPPLPLSPLLQYPLAQSSPVTHSWLFAQGGHLPPQSMSDSSPVKMPSVQVPGTQLPLPSQISPF